MSLTPENKARIAEEVEQALQRTGLPLPVACLLVALLVAAAWLAAKAMWDRYPHHRAKMEVYVVAFAGFGAMAAIATSILLRALVTARIFCLEMKGEYACGDFIMDAYGVVTAFSNIVSAHFSTGRYLLMLVLVTALAFIGWFGVFAAGRGLREGWRRN